MEAHRGPFIEDSSPMRAHFPLECKSEGEHSKWRMLAASLILSSGGLGRNRAKLEVQLLLFSLPGKPSSPQQQATISSSTFLDQPPKPLKDVLAGGCPGSL